jgi:hypothetical protein
MREPASLTSEAQFRLIVLEIEGSGFGEEDARIQRIRARGTRTYGRHPRRSRRSNP